MRKTLTATALGLVLVFGCIQGALWQYDRHQTRHAKNELIKANTSKASISEEELVSLQPEEAAWRNLTIKGNFIPTKEILLRNRYFEGKYGFGVITLFRSTSGRLYWIDRGWVIAGKDASTAPVTQAVTNQDVMIETRVRIELIEDQISGSVFAVSRSSDGEKLQQWNSDQAVKTEPVYLDLKSASIPGFTPKIPTALPEISDGPHLAYSFQWLLFAILVILAWFLVIREEKRIQSEKL